MTSCVTFKPVGRMGNFLFETASAMAYAWDHGLEFAVPTTTNDAYWNPIYLQHLNTGRYDGVALETVVVTEKVFPYHKREFQEAWRNDHRIVLSGYWQTEKYFKKYRREILKQFNFPWTSIPKTVSVHVRRGDYLTIKKGNTFKHPPVTKEWYERQMSRFPAGTTFCFFSDDLKWCEEQFGNRKDVMVTGRLVLMMHQPPQGWNVKSDEELDLIAMSCCEHHICSASTFSWWGAWLNQNPRKHIVIPTHWLTPGWGGTDCRDVVPNEWTRA